MKALASKEVKVVIADISDSVEALTPMLVGTDVFISAIGGLAQQSQMNLITAAKEAGVKRFVPCDFASIAPPGGVMVLRDEVRLLF